MPKYIRKLLPWLIVLFVILLPSWLTPSLVMLSNFDAADGFQLLGTLLFISLLLERFLEIFITTWRGSETDLKELRIENFEEEITRLTSLAKELEERVNMDGEIKKLVEKVEAAEEDLTQYKSETKRLAQWAGFVLGLLVSAVGFRSLQSLVEPAALASLPGVQRFIFGLVDVFLTGGLIAGGSDGIHKIAQVFYDFMDATAARARGDKVI